MKKLKQYKLNQFEYEPKLNIWDAKWTNVEQINS